MKKNIFFKPIYELYLLQFKFQVELVFLKKDIN